MVFTDKQQTAGYLGRTNIRCSRLWADVTGRRFRRITEDTIIEENESFEPDDEADGVNAEVTFPEAVMLLLFNPRNGTFAGEGLNLMYVLGGAMFTELASRGHIELIENGRQLQRVGPAPASSLLRGAWDRVPESPTGTRSLVVDIGTRSRETTLDRLVVRGDIKKTSHRLLGFIRTHSLEGGDTDTRDQLLAPVRAALVDGTEPEARIAAVIALLSASKNLPSMHADIPWSGDVHTRGKKFERGDWGAKAVSDVILTALVTQLAGVAFATALARFTGPD
ncbi:hypothetical protein B7R21_16815 [Subtercola boreus]|uniref:GPP34 family phosphoprotein n=1 Tax=Subtercola boreus TaxID=120213 RepID=A0A3E0VBP9_9MICO|nr:GPP34 family phosphoprotein [Subtercola boreus]RFA07119.1 hypothetical protein B7R21_16815 [Subtercola boreus]